MEHDDEEIIRRNVIEYLARRAYFCRDFADKISANTFYPRDDMYVLTFNILIARKEKKELKVNIWD